MSSSEETLYDLMIDGLRRLEAKVEIVFTTQPKRLRFTHNLNRCFISPGDHLHLEVLHRSGQYMRDLGVAFFPHLYVRRLLPVKIMDAAVR